MNHLITTECSRYVMHSDNLCTCGEPSDRPMTALDLARRYSEAGVPLVLWPRDTLPTVAPPPPTRPCWVKSADDWELMLGELRGCYELTEAEALP